MVPLLRHAALVLSLGVAACVASPPSPGVVEALSNVKGALKKAYDLKDSTALQMASLHLLPQTEGAEPAARTYHAAYMSMLTKSLWEVRVANSSDLINWTFHKKILPDADMPFAFPLSNGWVLLAHEQWMRTSPGPGSEGGFAHEPLPLLVARAYF
jgi:hypothetical protein